MAAGQLLEIGVEGRVVGRRPLLAAAVVGKVRSRKGTLSETLREEALDKLPVGEIVKRG